MKKTQKYLMLLIALIFSLTPVVSTGAQVHRVAIGESLFSISQKYGVTYDEIAELNRFLLAPERIFNKQILLVPKDKENTYRVKAQDSLYKISNSLNVSVLALAAANNITDVNSLHVGQLLNIPVIKEEPTPAPKSASVPINNNIYTVVGGDTLYKIALTNGTTVADITQVNNIKEADPIMIGQQLIIPQPVKREPEKSFQLTVAQLVKLHPETFYLKGKGSDRRIALTFDDGPNPTYTSQILDILKKYNVKATFFIMGSRAEANPELLQRMIAEGHVIGNHTWSHPDLRKVQRPKLTEELKRTEDAIEGITGKRTALMRPPYGAVNQENVEGLIDMNYKIINWSVDSVDWRDKDVDAILVNTLKGIRRNDIVLFHDSSGEGVSMQATVDTLPELIETLSLHGYSFVTVDKLLDVEAYK